MDQETKQEFEDLTLIVKESFEKVDKRFDAVDSRLDHIDSHIFAIRQELEDIRHRLESLEQATKEDTDAFAKDILELRSRLTAAEKQIAVLMEGKVAA